MNRAGAGRQPLGRQARDAACLELALEGFQRARVASTHRTDQRPPREPTGDAELGHRALDAFDGSHAPGDDVADHVVVPFAPQGRQSVGQGAVEIAGRVAGVARAACVRFQHDDAPAGCLQGVGDGQAGDPAAHHQHVRLEPPGQRRQRRAGCFPIHPCAVHGRPSRVDRGRDTAWRVRAP
jgi:hypothetical protein